MFCHKCGKSVGQDYSFCRYCGAKLDDGVENAPNVADGNDPERRPAPTVASASVEEVVRQSTARSTEERRARQTESAQTTVSSDTPSASATDVGFFRRLFDWRGRSSRSEYWRKSPLLFAAFILPPIFLFLLIFFRCLDSPPPPNIYRFGFFFIIVLESAFIVPAIALFSRRLHDFGRSSAWSVPFLLPFIHLMFILTSGALEQGYLGKTGEDIGEEILTLYVDTVPVDTVPDAIFPLLVFIIPLVLHLLAIGVVGAVPGTPARNKYGFEPSVNKNDGKESLSES